MKNFIAKPENYGVVMYKNEVIGFIKEECIVNLNEKKSKKTDTCSNIKLQTKTDTCSNIKLQTKKDNIENLREEVKKLAKEKMVSGAISRTEIKDFIENELNEECIADLNIEKLNKLKEKLNEEN
jgi:hypothetical protein